MGDVLLRYTQKKWTNIKDIKWKWLQRLKLFSSMIYKALKS